MLEGGLQRGGALSQEAATKAGAYETGAELRGYGAETGLNKMLEASRYSTELGYEAGMTGLQTELDVTKQAGILRSMGYEKEADMLISNAMTQAAYSDKAFNINELLPFEAKAAYYTGGTQQYDPFAAKMETYGDITGYAAAERQGILDKQIANRQMWGNMIGSVLSGGTKVLSSLLMGGGE